MSTHLKLATPAGLLCLALTLGCKEKPAPAPAAAAPMNVLRDATAHSNPAAVAAQHPPFKVFLQKIDIPTVIVVAENTTDDQLKSLLWYLRIKIREGKFKELGLQPTRVFFDKPGYSSGTISIYRGTKCAHEMYTAGGPDPCGSSIHKSAGYHWGDGGNRHADGADIISAAGSDIPVFDAADGWQTDDEARTDPNGTLKREVNARIQYAQEQTADMVKQHSDIRFFVDDPDDVLNVISRQFLVEATENSFRTQFHILEQDHVCALHFKAINLIRRGSTSKLYPLDCGTK